MHSVRKNQLVLGFMVFLLCFYGLWQNSGKYEDNLMNLTKIMNRPYASDVHFPLILDGNDALDVFCTGNGTNGLDISSAHIIENYIFNTLDMTACDLRNIDRFLIIRNCTFLSNNENQASTNAGLYLQNTTNIIIVNCTFQRNPYGIYAVESRNINITQNILLNSSQSIAFENSNDSLIQHNRINNTIQRLFAVFSSNNLTVFNNTCIKFSDGMFFMGTNQSLIHNNTFLSGENFDIATQQDYNLTIVNNTMERGINFAVGSDQLEHTTNHIIENNQINNLPLYYFKNHHSMTSANFSNAGQIILANCSDSHITDLTLSNAMNAIRLCYCVNITVAHNNLTNFIFAIDMMNAANNTLWNNIVRKGMFGVSMYRSENNNISQNTLTNLSYGIQIGEANNNTFIENIIENQSVNGIEIILNSGNNVFCQNQFKKNDIGVAITFGNKNTFEDNIFMENRIGVELQTNAKFNNFSLNWFRNNTQYQAFDIGQNYWNTSTVGNYWSDYESRYPFTANDGYVWLTPYVIAGATAQDNLPKVIPIPLSINHPEDFSIEINTTYPIPWVLTENAVINAWFVVIRNGTEIWNNTWVPHENLNIFTNVTSLGIFNFTIIATDGMGSYVEDQVIIRAFNLPPILSNSPLDVEYECNTTNHFITWTVTDNSIIKPTYTLFRNGTELINASWQSAVPILWNIDGLAIGHYNYTIKAFDGYNETIIDEVIIFVSNRNPSFISVPSDLSFECNSTLPSINWTATDNSWTSLTYRIYQNGVFLKTGLWSSGIPITFQLENIEPGMYTFTLIIYDGYDGQNSTSVIINVTNLPPIFVDFPKNISYDRFSTGNSLTWRIFDRSSKNAFYLLYRDGILIYNQTWTSDKNITINIDGLTAGMHNFTIIVLDGWGASINHTVVVTVKPISIQIIIYVGVVTIIGIVVGIKIWIYQKRKKNKIIK